MIQSCFPFQLEPIILIHCIEEMDYNALEAKGFDPWSYDEEEEILSQFWDDYFFSLFLNLHEKSNFLCKMVVGGDDLTISWELSSNLFFSPFKVKKQQPLDEMKKTWDHPPLSYDVNYGKKMSLKSTSHVIWKETIIPFEKSTMVM